MASAHQISKTLIKPSPLPESIDCHHLTPWGLACLPTHYIQYGLLFSSAAPTDQSTLDRLKSSLSTALYHFYPLAGRLKTEREDDGIFVYVDVGDCEGVEFIHAEAGNVRVVDVADDEASRFVWSFFPLNEAIGYDGHFLPLFAVQVTELADGIFLGCSFNHTVGDGTSCLNFLRTWSQIYQNEPTNNNKNEPICLFGFEDIANPPIKLPFKNPYESIDRLSPPPPELRERMFHISAQSISKLKSEVNTECKIDIEISSLQSLCSLIWRTVTRARRLPPEQETSCRLAANNRPRLRSPLPDEFFGCAAVFVTATTTAGELIRHGLGWGAMLVHKNVIAHTDSVIRNALTKWVEAPIIIQPSKYDRYGITVGSSPRFDLYGCEFGWGRAVAVRSGLASKYDGKVAMYMGREGKGSVDLELNLAPATMAVLLLDEEFMCAVST